jgi:hypothetical protein
MQLLSWYTNIHNGYTVQVVHVLSEPHPHPSTQLPLIDILQYSIDVRKGHLIYDIKQTSEYVHSLLNHKMYKIPSDKDFQWVIKAVFA